MGPPGFSGGNGMIETLYSLDALQTPVAFFLAFLIGLGFGTALEQAGFGSSRRLSAIFYFQDMTVLKVMFTAVITAMLGLSYCFALGLLKPGDVNLLETMYGAQVIGGLLFGIGFVMGGWCPGTAAVGVAGGRIDALVFLIGAMLGSLVFNESFPLVKHVANMGNRGVLMVYDVLGVSRPLFALGFTAVAIISFWGSEVIEEYQGKGNLSGRLGSLILVTIGFLVAASGLFLPIPSLPGVMVNENVQVKIPAVQRGQSSITYQNILETVSQGEDHIEPEDLAQRLIMNESGLSVVDTRSAAEFNRFHIRGALNIPLPSLFEGLIPFKNRGMIVLYSTGMTHPAQARDLLQLQGFDNVFILTDGINGFITRCLKPISVRNEPTSPKIAQQISVWRNYFLAGGL
jgi:thiosulfate/3-mercaptopyruvate sulfurtransferase